MLQAVIEVLVGGFLVFLGAGVSVVMFVEQFEAVLLDGVLESALGCRFEHVGPLG